MFEKSTDEMENESLARLSGVRVAFCLTASYCTLAKALVQMKKLFMN